MSRDYLCSHSEVLVSENEENTNIISDLNDYSPNHIEAESAATAVEQALATKTEEAKAFQDKYLRLAAEFENFKRLAQKQKQDYSQFANENLLKELLPVVDNLERAL
ncbi:MAG: nucleotide exchange factor GrpE, partial [Nitrospira sp.]